MSLTLHMRCRVQEFVHGRFGRDREGIFDLQLIDARLGGSVQGPQFYPDDP